MSPDNPAVLAGRGFSQTVEGAVDPSPATMQYVRVDHRGLDLALGQFARMRAVVKQEEAANPVEVSLLGTTAVMPGTQDFYHAVVEPRRRLTRE